jgi:predicted secreted hydrolase
MRVSFPYWEGAVKIIDSVTGQAIGEGYVELTGYAESMQGTF